MYLRELDAVPNKRTHGSIRRSIEKEMEEIEKIRNETPKKALEKEAEYKKLHEELDKKRKTP